MRGDRYMLMEVIKDTALDSIKLLPFLYITYLLIELIEHKVGEAGRARIGAAKKSGPIWGALFGIIPQCGFSAAPGLSLLTCLATYTPFTPSKSG